MATFASAARRTSIFLPALPIAASSRSRFCRAASQAPIELPASCLATARPVLRRVPVARGAAALIGIEYRYRFPLDPLLNVLAAGGLLAIPSLARSVWRRASPGRADRPLPTPARTTS